MSGTYVDPASDVIVAASILCDRLEWNVLDDRFRDAFAALKNLHDADFAVIDATAAGPLIPVAETPCFPSQAGKQSRAPIRPNQELRV